MKIISISGFAGLALLLAACASAPTESASDASDSPAATSADGFPVTLNNCGTELTVAQPPQRAVSLNQSATEILLELGVGERVVGTGYQTTTVPADIAAEYDRIPLLSDGIIKHETLLQAQPDFVYSSFASFLTAENAGEREELRQLGVPSYLTEFDCTYHAAVAGGAKFELLLDEIHNLARIFGVPDAGDRVVAAQQAVLDRGSELATQIQGEPSVVWFYSTAASSATPSVAGPGGLPQTVTEILGAKNLFADAHNKWPEVSWDEIARRNPDVIILADLTRGYPGDTAQEKLDFLRTDPLTRGLDAVLNHRFIIVPGQFMDPSIHSVEALPTVAEGLIRLGGKQ